MWSIIAMGMRFDDRVTGDLNRYAKQAKIIHFEIDPAEVNKNVPVDVAVLGNIKKTLPKITEKVNKNNHENWLKEFRKRDEIEYQTVIEKDLHPTKDEMTMGEVIHAINEETKGDAIIVTDVGQHRWSLADTQNSTSQNPISHLVDWAQWVLHYLLL